MNLYDHDSLDACESFLEKMIARDSMVTPII